SSVIVSLLAGFIYYQFNTIIENSFDKVFTADEMEINVPLNGDDAISNFNNPQKVNSVKKTFRKSISKTKTLKSFSESATSDISKDNQAKTEKPVPDLNIDFTAELNNLLKKNNRNSGIRKSKSLSNLTAENNANQNSQRSVINKECFSATVNKDFVNGNGFEFNHVISKDSKLKNKRKTNKKDFLKSNTGFESDSKYTDECKSSDKVNLIKATEHSENQNKYSRKNKSEREFNINQDKYESLYTSTNKNLNIVINKEIRENSDCKKKSKKNQKK
ncbi:MAG TPA: hypothetical protein PK536_07995, partial [Ignavibacteria bacterium]|nr:hypothetical protein [Bacteroidota bacterium]HRI85375.1 hypothetical protein [Ignavibacteria bacterium]